MTVFCSLFIILLCVAGFFANKGIEKSWTYNNEMSLSFFLFLLAFYFIHLLTIKAPFHSFSCQHRHSAQLNSIHITLADIPMISICFWLKKKIRWKSFVSSFVTLEQVTKRMSEWNGSFNCGIKIAKSNLRQTEMINFPSFCSKAIILPSWCSFFARLNKEGWNLKGSTNITLFAGLSTRSPTSFYTSAFVARVFSPETCPKENENVLNGVKQVFPFSTKTKWNFPCLFAWCLTTRIKDLQKDSNLLASCLSHRFVV